MNESTYKPSSCYHCGATSSDPVLNEKGQNLYWMAANKGTKDFLILTSALKETFVGSLTPSFPRSQHEKFDFYCTKCFIKFSEESKSFKPSE